VGHSSSLSIRILGNDLVRFVSAQSGGVLVLFGVAVEHVRRFSIFVDDNSAIACFDSLGTGFIRRDLLVAPTGVRGELNMVGVLGDGLLLGVKGE